MYIYLGLLHSDGPYLHLLLETLRTRQESREDAQRASEEDERAIAVNQ